MNYLESYDREQVLYAMRFMECIMRGERNGWLTVFDGADIEDIQATFDNALADFNSEESTEKYAYFGEFCEDWLVDYQDKNKEN